MMLPRASTPAPERQTRTAFPSVAPHSGPLARFGSCAAVAACVVGMAFALDWGRIIFFAAPVFYVAAAQVLRGRRTLALVTVAALFALDLGYAIYMQAYGVQHHLDAITTAIYRVPVF